MVRLLVDGVYGLAAGEPLVHHADLVDGFGRWRLGLDGWCWVVMRAESTSASSSASPSSTATLSSGRLLLLLSCRRGRLVGAVTLDVPLIEASVAADFVGAWIGVRCVAHDRVEAMGTLAIFDAGHRFVLSLLALDLRARHRHAVKVGRPLIVHVRCRIAGWGRGRHGHRVRGGVGGGWVRLGGVSCSRCVLGWPGGRDL